MTDFGYIALIIGLVASIYTAAAAFAGQRWGHTKLLASARSGVFVTFGMVTMATVGLLVALLGHDFELDYVASYTSRDMSWPYLVSALWAGNAGSLLTWGWLLTIFAVLMVSWKSRTDEKLLPYAISVVMITIAFFLILLVFIASPFDKLATVPRDGTGLHPLLQNPGMIFHPPTLFLGFAGLTIPFAFAMSALITKMTNSDWLDGLRRWVLIAWLFLTIGNVLGAWWAYVELGWGGYWGWDPVENSSLIPWLVATVLLHAIVMQRSRGRYRLWTIALTIMGFVLPILATFFTRTGVLSSVHAFNDTGMGPLFLTFIGLSVIGPSILLFWNRRSLEGDRRQGSLASKEGALEATNLVFIIASAIIFLGTLFPLWSELFGGDQANLTPSFFNLAVGPFFLIAIMFIGICTLIGWRRVTSLTALKTFIFPAAAALGLGLYLAFASSVATWAMFTFSFSTFAMCAILTEVCRTVIVRSRARAENPFKSLVGSLRASRTRYGAMIVHLGIALMAIGVAGSSALQAEAEDSIALGESITVNQYTIVYEDFQVRQDSPIIDTVTVTLSIYDSDKFVGEMFPEKYFHHNFEQPVTEVAIRSTWREDLYVILAGWDAGGSLVALQVIVNPAVMWIWIGGGFLTFGGIIALWPRRKPVPGKTVLDDDIEREVMRLRRSGSKNEGSVCPKCGAEYPEGGLFCPQCGQELH